MCCTGCSNSSKHPRSEISVSRPALEGTRPFAEAGRCARTIGGRSRLEVTQGGGRFFKDVVTSANFDNSPERSAGIF